MECDKQKVYELMVGDLPTEEYQPLLEHLKSCKKCSERAKIMGILEYSAPISIVQKKTKSKWLLGVAAALIILFIPISHLIWKESAVSKKTVAELATRDTYPYFPLEVRAQENGPKQAAFQFYQAGDFEGAEALFNQISRPDAEVCFYRGVTRYFLGKYVLARIDLEKSRIHSTWEEASSWYLANLYLRTGQRSEALTELGKIVQQNGHFALEAKHLSTMIRAESNK